MVSMWCLAQSGWSQSSYHTNRAFNKVNFSIPGVPTAYEVYNMAGQLTMVVGPTNVITNSFYSKEYMSVVLGHESSASAWSALLAGYPANNCVHSNKFYDNAGWIKGLKQTTDGKWGGYIWAMQNTVNFTTSVNNVWISTNGVTNSISKVLVGTIGDFLPMEVHTNTGPSLEGLTNNPPSGGSLDNMSYTANFTAYYELTNMPAIWIVPALTNVCVNFGNVNFSLSENSIAPGGVDWSITPTSGVTLTGYPSNAIVNVGSIATSYVIRATSYDNTNIFGLAVLNVLKVESVELVSGATNQNVIPPSTWVAVKDTNATPGYVTVKAVLNPDIYEANLPANFVTWTGGEAVDGHHLQRRVSKGSSAHTQMIAGCGGSSATGDVWVVWSYIEIRMTGTTYQTPNSARFEDEYDGTEDLGSKLYNYYYTGTTNIISRAAAGKVAPIGKLEPVGIFEITTNGWIIERDIIRHDYKDGAVWQDRWCDDWTNDSTTNFYPPFTKFNPDNYDQIYDLDGPNIAKFQGISGIVTNSCEKYDHFRQWITWNGTKCSDYSLWYWYARWKDNTNLNLQIELMEVGLGNPDFPTNMPYYSPP